MNLYSFCIFFVFLMLIIVNVSNVNAQEPAFELPVELVGFPVIIVAVRLSNFVKKLAYSLNPKTYIPRTKRELPSSDMINMVEAEKRLVQALGENVCIYRKVCLHHAEKAQKTIGNRSNYEVDWEDLLSNYKDAQETQKEFYLLSVFLGDLIASPKFCNQLAKRGRECHV